MRSLYILRHARSDMLQGVDDKDRPLTGEGFGQANMLAAKMQERDYHPDFILCSPAKRTRQTCAAISEKWPDAPVQYEERIYMAATGQLYEFLKDIDNAHESALLVGHNPGMHGLAQFLIGAGDPALLAKINAGYKPGCLCVIDFDCASWRDLLPGAGRLDDLLGV